MWIPKGRPGALAIIKGGRYAQNLSGTVKFYSLPEGVLVEAKLHGLPGTGEGFFGFHIHQGESCTGSDFADTRSHFDIGSNPHPGHAGDMPPLLRCCGDKACLAFVTSRFSLRDIIGKTVVIHSGADDFHTHPAGNAGTKIACGVIRRY